MATHFFFVVGTIRAAEALARQPVMLLWRLSVHREPYRAVA
jgi:hypothetical protein